MQQQLKFYLAVLTLSLATPSWAEQIIVPVGSQQGAAVVMPPKGMSMSQVESRYGAPNDKSGPVGQPPISTWEYPGFTVYFEHQHTIHSVVKHKPQPQTAPAPEPAAEMTETPEEVDE